jgi:hypothetical protein
VATKDSGRRNKEHDSASREKALLDALSSSFSREEIQRILARSLLSLDVSGIERLAAMLDPETTSILRGVLASQSETAETRTSQPSSDKIRQEWLSAWEDWDGCVAETGDEEGKYVVQEHHWEPPYLDKSAFTEDLEHIAARMSALIPQVIERNLAPDFSFADTLKNAAEEVGSGLSEWIEDSGEGTTFGPKVTGCLLQWEWRTSRREKLGAFEFADRICGLEQSCEDMGLDHSAIRDFVFALKAEAQREILEGIVRHRPSGHWFQALESVYGGWFELYQELCRKWDPSRYLETCRRGISQNWQLALPVIQDLIARKAFQDAVVLVEEAVRSMLRSKEGECWDPRSDLLIRNRSLYSEGEKRAVISLLSHWLKLALALGNEEQVWALKLQLVVLRRWTDGDAILEALRRVPSPRFDSIRERLYEEWRLLIAEHSVRFLLTDAPGHKSAWVHGLVDAARAGASGPALLRGVIRGWLEEIAKTDKSLQQAFGALAVLTLDLDCDSQLAATFPMLKQLLIKYEGGNLSVTATRRNWFRRLGGTELFPELIEFWKRNAARLVPEPEHSAGDYSDCANWLAALHTLDSASYRKILEAWKLKHRRRRNLWKALERVKVPLS